MRFKSFFSTFLPLLFLAADRLVKSLALSGIVRTSWFGLYINSGALFSVPLPNKLIVGCTVVVVVALALSVIRNFKLMGPLERSLFLIIIVGACSNLYDRIRFQGVVDMLSFGYGSIFNIADAGIVVAVGGLLWLHISGKKTSY